MGANYIEATLPGSYTREQVINEFREMRRQAEIEDGSSYSGNWNMVNRVTFDETPETIYPCERAASERAEAKSVKWENAHAVKFIDVDILSLAMPVKFQKLAKDYYQLTGLRFSINSSPEVVEGHMESLFKSELLGSLQNGPRLLKNCPICGSQVAVKFLHSMQCPVCSKQFPLTVRDAKMFESKKAKLKTLTEKLTAMQLAAQAKQLKKEIARGRAQTWLIGANCAS